MCYVLIFRSTILVIRPLSGEKRCVTTLITAAKETRVPKAACELFISFYHCYRQSVLKMNKFGLIQFTVRTMDIGDGREREI